MADSDRLKQESAQEKTFVKGLGFISQSADGNVTAVEVKDGKIIRLRPLYYGSKYKPEEYGPWDIKARGKSFKPFKKSLLAPFILS
jgi:hypothetical protein